MGALKYVEELQKKKQSDVLRFLLRVRCWEVSAPRFHNELALPHVFLLPVSQEKPLYITVLKSG